jgi:nitrogenase molybdenum-iron protein beta chain
MQTILKSPRNGCGLHGAISTIEAIGGIVPIVHSNAGCAIQNYLAGKAGGAGQGRLCGENIPSTNAQERHIIFGGASRLREQIKNTLKVVNGDLYIVLNSCESAMVGDDVEAMTREAREQGEPVIECLTAGFHGDSHYGYETVMTDLIKKLPQVRELTVEKDEKLVNLFGILPGKDVHFLGNLETVKRILESVGVKVNTFFGPVNGVEELANAQNAALNIVFSKWGLAPARQLELQYNIPNLVFSALPVGPEEVADFVKQVAEVLSLDEEVVNSYLNKEQRRFDYYYQSILEDYFDDAAARPVALVGDESEIVGVAGFLKKYLGVEIQIAVATDYFGKSDLPQNEKSQALSKLAKEVYFTQDGKEINDILTHSDVELILGSSLENQAAEKKGIVNLEISYPVYNKTITNKSYAGVDGALTLLEDYLTAVKKANALKEETLDLYIRGEKREVS